MPKIVTLQDHITNLHIICDGLNENLPELVVPLVDAHLKEMRVHELLKIVHISARRDEYLGVPIVQIQFHKHKDANPKTFAYEIGHSDHALTLTRFPNADNYGIGL